MVCGDVGEGVGVGGVLVYVIYSDGRHEVAGARGEGEGLAAARGHVYGVGGVDVVVGFGVGY